MVCFVDNLLVNILTKTLPTRSMQDSDIKNHGRIRPENGTRFILDPCKIFDMVEPWCTQDPDMIKLWCTQDPYKDQYATWLTKQILAWLCMYIYVYVCI